MKIIQAINDIDLSHGGPSRSMPTMCLGLKREGITCQVLAYHSGNPNEEKLIKASIPIRYIECEHSRIPRIFAKGFQLPKDIVGSDCLVHIQHIWSVSMHNIARDCRKRGIPYIISPRGSLTPWALELNRWKKIFGMWLYQTNDLKNAVCLHATAMSELEDIRRLGFNNPVAVIPNGIVTANYPLKTYGDKKTDYKHTLLFLSRIHPKKGLPILLEAWKQLPHAITDNWQIVIAGEGNEEYTLDNLRQLIKEQYSGLPINIVGPQYGNEKLRSYHNADLFILPSHSENFGMVIAEAMCCGVPTITTTGTPWEILQQEGCGWWVKPTVDGIREALRQGLTLSDDELQDKGKKSRQIILDHFSIEAVAKMYQKLYLWLLGQGEKPSFIYE